jgi:integrase/recombinase XerD
VPPLKVIRSVVSNGDVVVRVGQRQVDEYLEFVAARARLETLLATAFDLKVLFAWAGKRPSAVTTKDVVAFVVDQRRGDSR